MVRVKFGSEAIECVDVSVKQRGNGVRVGSELSGVPVVVSGVRERLVLVFHVNDVSLLKLNRGWN